MRLFDSAQDLVAAQITKMYKDDRKGGKEIRNRPLVGDTRSMGECYHWSVSKGFTGLEGNN